MAQHQLGGHAGKGSAIHRGCHPLPAVPGSACSLQRSTGHPNQGGGQHHRGRGAARQGQHPEGGQGRQGHCWPLNPAGRAMAGMPQKTNQHHHAQQNPHQQQRHGRPQYKAIQIEDEQHSGHQQGVRPGHGGGNANPWILRGPPSPHLQQPPMHHQQPPQHQPRAAGTT